MTANDAAPLPDDLPALRRWLADRPDAADLFELPIREVVVRSDALAAAAGPARGPGRARAGAADPGRSAVPRAGADLKPLVHDLLAGAGRDGRGADAAAEPGRPGPRRPRERRARARGDRRAADGRGGARVRDRLRRRQARLLHGRARGRRPDDAGAGPNGGLGDGVHLQPGRAAGGRREADAARRGSRTPCSATWRRWPPRPRR